MYEFNPIFFHFYQASLAHVGYSCVDKSICHTSSLGMKNWWYLDLGKEYTIRKVVMQGGKFAFRHNGHRIMVGNNPNISLNHQVGVIAFLGSYAFYEFPINPPMQASYVGVLSPGDWANIMICNFYVY